MIILSTAVGLAMNFIGIDPIKALVYTAVFNGIAAVPLLFLIARINGSEAILGALKGGILSRSMVWLTFGVMALAAVALLYTTVMPHGPTTLPCARHAAANCSRRPSATMALMARPGWRFSALKTPRARMTSSPFRARLTRLFTVPSAQPQMVAASR